jgi:nucleoside-diphosphate-sugar epimerase
MKNNIFITGGSGFIGRNLIEKLLSDENQIYALTRSQREFFDERVKVVQGDIQEPESFVSIIKECDVVFHCAAYISFQKKDFQKAYQVNVEGTRNILESAYQGGVKKVIHLSTCAVLGFSHTKDRIISETANPEIDKTNIYAYTKKLAEEEVKKYVKKGLNVSIANIVTVYGQGDRNLNSGTIIKSVYEGKMRIVPPGGTSFVSINDLIDGLMLLVQKGKPGERYIFCTENMEYKELVQRIAKVLKVQSPRYVLPNFTYYPALCAIKGIEFFSWFKNRKINLLTPTILKQTYGYKYFSSNKAKKILGWRPSQSLEEAVIEAFRYYKENNLF